MKLPMTFITPDTMDFYSDIPTNIAAKLMPAFGECRTIVQSDEALTRQMQLQNIKARLEECRVLIFEWINGQRDKPTDEVVAHVAFGEKTYDFNLYN